MADPLARAQQTEALHRMQPLLMQIAHLMAGYNADDVLSAAVNFAVVAAEEARAKHCSPFVVTPAEETWRAFMVSVGEELIRMGQRTGETHLLPELKAAQAVLRARS